MRYLPEVVSWVAAGVGLWLLTLSSVSPPELAVAVVAALPCALVAVAARRVVRGSWPPVPRWSRWLLPLPAAALGDSLRVLGLAAGVLAGRPIPGGEVRAATLTRDRCPGRWRTRQAAAVLLVTATPGAVVLDIDQDSGRMLVHRLGAGRPAMEEVVGR